jgi:hypothetical protein
LPGDTERPNLIDAAPPPPPVAAELLDEFGLSTAAPEPPAPINSTVICVQPVVLVHDEPDAVVRYMGENTVHGPDGACGGRLTGLKSCAAAPNDQASRNGATIASLLQSFVRIGRRAVHAIYEKQKLVTADGIEGVAGIGAD